MTVQTLLILLAVIGWGYAVPLMIAGKGDRFDVKTAALSPVVLVLFCARFLDPASYSKSVEEIHRGHLSDRSHTREIKLTYGGKTRTIIIPSLARVGSFSLGGPLAPSHKHDKQTAPRIPQVERDR